MFVTATTLGILSWRTLIMHRHWGNYQLYAYDTPTKLEPLTTYRVLFVSIGVL